MLGSLLLPMLLLLIMGYVVLYFGGRKYLEAFQDSGTLCPANKANKANSILY